MSRRRHLHCLALGTLVCVLAAGCGRQQPQSRHGGRSYESTRVPGFPVTVTDALGNRVTLQQPPQRIVSLAPNTTEILFALGLGRRVVGVSDDSNYPPAAANKPKLGGVAVPSLERIIALSPDLAVGNRLNPRAMLEKLRASHIPVYAADPQTVEQVLDNIQAIGRLTGTTPRAQRLVRDLRAQVRQIRSAQPKGKRPSVLFLLSDQPPWVAGRETFVDDLIRLAGGRNVANDVQGFAPLSLEAIALRNPEVILVGMMVPAADAVRRVRRLPGLSTTTGARQGKIYALNPDLVLRPGPRVVEGLSEMAEVMNR